MAMERIDNMISYFHDYLEDEYEYNLENPIFVELPEVLYLVW
jgi:hypothetical protein